MTDSLHNSGRAATLDALAGLGLVAVLLDSGYVLDADDAVLADVVANELTTTGYVRTALVFSAAVKDDATDSAKLSCSAISWLNIGVPAGVDVGRLVVARIITNDADSPIIASWAVTATLKGAALTITPAAAGLFASP